MVSTSIRSIVTALACFLVLGLLPAAAQAQTSTFVVPFDRSGFPEIDASGAVVPNTGALLNPCTAELVDVTGSSTITISQTVMNNGDLRVSVGVVSKGLGIGQVSLVQYPFRDSQTFSIRRPSAGGPAIDSTFTDKFVLKGPQSVDNWIVRATFRIRINSLGQVLIDLQKVSDGDVCRG